MKKLLIFLVLLLSAGFVFTPSSFAYVWGVKPANVGGELIKIDPFTGAVNTSYAAPGTITSQDTEIGLAGYSDVLFYTNADQANGTIFGVDPANGSVIGNYTVSGGWQIDGLGYYADSSGAWIYTSGCSVNDMHRYESVDGSSPEFYYSDVYDPRAVAGDNGGRVFTYASIGDVYGIYEVDPVVNTAATFFASSPSDSIVGMAYDGSYLYLSDLDGYLYSMDNQGAMVNALDLGYSFYALASTEGTGGEPVPEPATMLLFGVGLLGMLTVSRRKFRKF